MTALLTLASIACIRGDRLLFAGIDMTLASGDALVVGGPNGVGKSSLLRIAAGLLRPSSGSVARTGRTAWLGERCALDGERTLGDALRFWASLDGTIGRVGGAMEEMGIDMLAPVPVRYLSTGQRRRAAIARAIATGAALWIFDEPANGLDAEGLDRLGIAIVQHRSAGGAILAATHLPLPVVAPAELVLAPGRAAPPA